MSGLQSIPIRAPAVWDPAWFERFVRDTLAKSDIRNAIAASGISITGTSDEVATLSASADVQALIDASLLTATNESLSNARQVIAGSPAITIDDNGAGSTLEIDVGVIPWPKLGQVPDLSVLGTAFADDGYDPVLPIQSSSNDTLLRRVSDELDFGTLTAGMLADVDTGDLAEGSNLYFTDERAQDAVGGILADTSSIDFTYDDGTPSVSAVVLPGGVDHDSLLNYVADEHVAHSSVTLTAGAGLTGGGDISASRSFAVGEGTGITVNADDIALSAATLASLALADTSVQPGDNISGLTNDSGYLASVQAGDVDSEAATDGYVLTADGAGGAAWEAAGGGVSSLFDLSDVDADPGADRLAFWDDSDSALEWISEVPDSFLSSNVPLLNTNNTWTGQTQTVSNAGGALWRTIAGTVETRMQSNASAALVGTISGHDLTIRTNNTSRIFIADDGSEIQYDATLHDINGNADISGTLGVGSSLQTGGAITLAYAAPQVFFVESGVTADNTRWSWTADGETFSGRVWNDIASTQAAWVTVNRTANTVDEIQLDATALDFNGNLDANGTTMDIDGSTSLGLHGGSCDLSLSGSTAALTGALTVTSTGTATDWIATSDRRIKSEIRPIESAAEKVESLNGYTFLKKGTTGRQAGVIAQEVQVVLPEAVGETEDGTLTVKTHAVLGLLVAAVKELQEWRCKAHLR